MPPAQRPLRTKFWELVDKRGPTVSEFGRCWMFKNKFCCGYGGIWHNKKEWRANRISWIIHYGKIPEDMFVLHKCDNPPCVRPSHLFLGDYQDNHDDMRAKNRQAPTEETRRPGSLNGRAILHETDVVRILQWPLHYNGELRDLAKELGVSKGVIEAIRSGRNWKQLFEYHSKFGEKDIAEYCRRYKEGRLNA